MRRTILSERSLVVVLFILVIVIFSFAQQDTRHIEKMYFDPGDGSVLSFDQAGASGASHPPILR